TCLWLKNLPKLQPTNIVKPICSWVSGGSKDSHGNKRSNTGMTFRDSKTRSKTFPGIAKAMAEQWAGKA
ncbi:MAG: DNA cytosine methyltransferase, partial [Clostridia bacterium]|nr:DNA cytosine methyltransferase [Clostridia bacterium]